MLKWETNQHIVSLLKGCALIFDPATFDTKEQKPPLEYNTLFMVVSECDTDTGRKLVGLGMEVNDFGGVISFHTDNATIAYKASELITTIEFKYCEDDAFYRGIYMGKIVEDFSKFEFPKLM